jgi:hypothetical protein
MLTTARTLAALRGFLRFLPLSAVARGRNRSDRADGRRHFLPPGHGYRRRQKVGPNSYPTRPPTAGTFCQSASAERGVASGVNTNEYVLRGEPVGITPEYFMWRPL